jgi:hypothetical protein
MPPPLYTYTHTHTQTGLRALAAERGWEVDVVPLVVGQRSVTEKEWLEALRTFGIGKEEGKRIIGRLGRTLLNEHEKAFRQLLATYVRALQ